MSGAVIVGGVIAAISTAIAILMWMASGMSDNISAGDSMAQQAKWVLIGGIIVGGLVMLSHFVPESVHHHHLVW